jgi:hypothetical protein
VIGTPAAEKGYPLPFKVAALLLALPDGPA